MSKCYRVFNATLEQTTLPTKVKKGGPRVVPQFSYLAGSGWRFHTATSNFCHDSGALNVYWIIVIISIIT